jgi:signal transduction histidine kinase
LRLQIDDDGPGLPTDLAPRIVRGQRWDETQPGTGFGLAITQDLAEGYRGRLDLDRSEFGGLSVAVTIPL